MTIDQIKAAVISGKTVHWKSNIYRVLKDEFDQWLILCTVNSYYVSLIHRDGTTMEDVPEDFFIAT